MSKSSKRLLLIIGLVFGAILAGLLIFYWIGQSQQRAIQVKVLNNRFAKVQPRNGKVLFVPSLGVMPMQFPSSTTSFAKPTVLSTGSQFEMRDDHFLSEYKITRIEADGVTIYYATDGMPPSAIRRAHGSVKLVWK